MRRILVFALLLISAQCVVSIASAQCPGSWMSLAESDGGFNATLEPQVSPGYHGPGKTAYISQYFCSGSQFSGAIIKANDGNNCEYTGTLAFGPVIPTGSTGWSITHGIQKCDQIISPGLVSRNVHWFNATFWP
jgi:hypothetical protein